MHKFKKNMNCNDLSMVWVDSETCIYCGIEKNEAGEDEVCVEYGKLLNQKAVRELFPLDED